MSYVVEYTRLKNGGKSLNEGDTVTVLYYEKDVPAVKDNRFAKVWWTYRENTWTKPGVQMGYRGEKTEPKVFDAFGRVLIKVGELIERYKEAPPGSVDEAMEFSVCR